MIILGIDPGLRNTGFGVINVTSSHKFEYITSGVIETNAKEDLADRLFTIASGVGQIITQCTPDIVCVEKVFVNSNPQSTLLLGQARGAAITASVLQGLPVREYTALQVKKNVVGYGHATKEQMQKMIMYLLHLNNTPSPDAADALACAITHYNHSKMNDIFHINSVKKGRIS